MHVAGAAPDTVPDGVLEDLHARLHAFHPVTLQPSNGWSLGVEPTYFTELMRHWRDDYDWRAGHRGACAGTVVGHRRRR